MNIVGIQLYFVNVLVCECSWTIVQGFTICECCAQAIQFVNVVGKQCMELNVMGKTCGDEICEHL